MPMSDGVEWVGPHIGRSARFLDLVEQFIAGLMEADVVAVDFKANYRDSAFHRLWECMDHSMVTQRHLEASSRDSASDVPYVCTDTVAYISAGVDEARRAAHQCGVDLGALKAENGAFVATLREPISEIIFQVWNAEESDEPRIAQICETVASRLGLTVDQLEDFQRFTLQLADNAEYRLHGVHP